MLFGTDGIRGRAGRGPLAPAFVTRVARAAGTLLRREPGLFATRVPAGFPALRTRPHANGPGRGTVLIGRDTRASGPSIERALARGFAAAGIPSLSAGVLSTPGVAHLTRSLGCSLGAVISASHNPADDNGIKFVSPQGFKIPDAAETAIETLVANVGSSSRRTEPRPLASARWDYLDFLEGRCRPLRGMKVALDCAHGAASALAGPLLESLGARVVVTCASPDGRNINRGCGALHPAQIAEVVRREKADVGVAFDGDADRAIFADERGRIRDGDHVLALGAVHLKARRALPRNTVVSTVMANFGLELFLRERGIALRRAKVGDRYVAEEMFRTGAILGGEPSGHVLFFDAAPTGDGMLTALRVLDILAERGESLSRVALAKCPQTIVNVPVSRKPPLEETVAVRRAVESARRGLGQDGRIIVRYSGTEPLCRVMVEGPSTALVDRLAQRVATEVREELS